jgi:hypothetical protein
MIRGQIVMEDSLQKVAASVAELYRNAGQNRPGTDRD